MNVTRFLLLAGQITSRLDIDVEKLNPALLLEATNALAKLEDKTKTIAPLKTYPVPGNPSFEVSLDDDSWETISWIQTNIPSNQPRMTRGLWELSQQASRIRKFHVKGNEERISFAVIQTAMMKDDPGLYAAIAGSFIRERDSSSIEQDMSGLIDKHRSEFKEVATQIWLSRPSLICFGTGSGLLHSFADCFATAFLLNQK